MNNETCPVCGSSTGDISLSAVPTPKPGDEVRSALSMEGNAIRLFSSILRSDKELLSGLEELMRLTAKSIAEWDKITDLGCPTCGVDVYPGRNARRKMHRRGTAT